MPSTPTSSQASKWAALLFSIPHLFNKTIVARCFLHTMRVPPPTPPTLSCPHPLPCPPKIPHDYHIFLLTNHLQAHILGLFFLWFAAWDKLHTRGYKWKILQPYTRRGDTTRLLESCKRTMPFCKTGEGGGPWTKMNNDIIMQFRFRFKSSSVWKTYRKETGAVAGIKI